MRGLIGFGPNGLMVAGDISSGGEAASFSRGPPTDTTGSCVPWASGMKPDLQRSAEASGNSPITVAIGGVQPHDAVERQQLGAWTKSVPVPTGGR